MVKIETAIEISDEYPSGKVKDFIWMLGQSWPVPEALDGRVMRLEAFGEELPVLASRFAGGTCLEFETCRTWYLEQARYISRQMRISYP